MGMATTRVIIYKRCNKLRGYGICLPGPRRTFIWHRDPELRPHQKAHELTHAAQVERLGWLGYYGAHIAQRNALYGFFRIDRKEWWSGLGTQLEREARDSEGQVAS